MKDQLTEQEVLKAASSVNCLRILREIGDVETSSEITLKNRPMGISAIPLTPQELQAVLALLKERHTVFLASLGIQPEEIPA